MPAIFSKLSYTNVLKLINSSHTLQYILYTVMQTGIIVYHYSKIRSPKLRVCTIDVNDCTLKWNDLVGESDYIGILHLHDITHINIGDRIASELQYEPTYNHTVDIYQCISILTNNGVLELQCVNSEDCIVLYLALLHICNNKSNHVPYNPMIHQTNILYELMNQLYKLYPADIIDAVLCNDMFTTANTTTLERAYESNRIYELKRLHTHIQYKIRCLNRCYNDRTVTQNWINKQMNTLDNELIQLNTQNVLLKQLYKQLSTTSL